jgi:hypothetical protein
MSQSDYIKYKKTVVFLENQVSFSPVLTTQDYISYKGFSLENITPDTTIRYNQLVPINTTPIFGMTRPLINACPLTTPSNDTCIDTRLYSIYSDKVFRVPILDSRAVPVPIPGYVKFPSIRRCAKCCYAQSLSDTKYQNTLLSACANKRLKNEICECR